MKENPPAGPVPERYGAGGTPPHESNIERSEHFARLDPLERLVAEETSLPPHLSPRTREPPLSSVVRRSGRREAIGIFSATVGGFVTGTISGIIGARAVDKQPTIETERRRASAQLIYRNKGTGPEVITFPDAPADHPHIQLRNWTGTAPLDEIYSYIRSHPDRTLIFTIIDPETNDVLQQITIDRHFSPSIRSDSYWIDAVQNALVFSVAPGKNSLAKVSFDEFEGTNTPTPVAAGALFSELPWTQWHIPDAPTAIVRSESALLPDSAHAWVKEIAKIADVAGIHLTFDIPQAGKICRILHQDTYTKMLKMGVSEGIFTNPAFENEGQARSYFTIMQGIFSQMMPRTDGTTAYPDPKYSEILDSFLSFHTNKRISADAQAKATMPHGLIHDYFPFQAVDLTTYEPGFFGNVPLRPSDNPQVDFASFATVLRFYPEALIERYEEQEKKEGTIQYSGPTFGFRKKTQNLITFATIVVGSPLNKYVRVNEALLTFFTPKALLLLLNKKILAESYRGQLGLPKP